MTATELAALNAKCAELRSFLIAHVSKNGGHLASNLGVVELTVALHKVYNTSVDRLIFDVGHQCYAHKILTGRRDGFKTLRSFGGIAGFPKPCESEHDAFVSGHASTSISVALGMARARSIIGGKYHIAAVIGDGALTGGQAYEALHDAGHSGLPMVVILNDNEMSITKNVGGVAKHLARLRNGQQYFKLKRIYHRLVMTAPGGRSVDRTLYKWKTGLKEYFFPSSLFESMGFTYLGPADGHDIKTLIRVLEYAKGLNKPILLHINTTKGKGYKYAEQNPPLYHGVPKFDAGKGLPKTNGELSFSGVFGQTLTELAENDKRICAITAAMGDAVGLSEFRKKYPKRFFDVGICEEHAVTMAAGMAKQGLRPFVAIYSTFLQRAFDQIIHDTAIMNLPVIFAVDRAGLVGDDGETHHGIFDTAFLDCVPNMTVLAPASYNELRTCIKYALELKSPVAIRYPRGGEGEYTGNYLKNTVLRKGDDITLVTYGTTVNDTLTAAEMLERDGISAAVVKLLRLTPIGTDYIQGKVLFVEEVYRNGSVAQRTGHKGLAIDGFVTHGTAEELRAMLGLDAAGIYKAAKEML
ncbi:MAG: 1-deoxy-D-xylulose-5-phosphate synthase [Oscillospiraceae bacterium]|nr:1-deoxy-D-xylulose-5-phosphate synthase [Oscillospiraceae bacterium]